MAEQFTPDEQTLIERLQNAPQPSLSQSSFEAIRAQMLNAMDAPPIPAPSPALPLPIVAGVIVVIVVIVTVIIVASGVLSPQTAPTGTPIPSLTTVPSSTPASTETNIPTVAITTTPETTPEVTSEATIEVTPEVTLEITAEPVIVIEGPVESINGNIITIFGVTIQINPDDPLLQVIQIGDVIRVEGDTQATIVVAVTVTYVNIEVNVNPSNSEVWRDNGSCDNPPPDWAPANGWRRRCQGQPQNNGSNGNNGNNEGSGKGMGKP